MRLDEISFTLQPRLGGIRLYRGPKRASCHGRHQGCLYKEAMFVWVYDGKPYERRYSGLKVKMPTVIIL